jgi:hypothetical protein
MEGLNPSQSASEMLPALANQWIKMDLHNILLALRIYYNNCHTYRKIPPPHLILKNHANNLWE